MKRAGIYLTIFILILTGCKVHKLTVNQKKGYQIVLPNRADSLEQRAAHKLQHYLVLMSDEKLPIVKENKYRGDKAFYIGRTDYANTRDVDFSRLKEDGYAYIRQGNNLVIAGGTEKGVLYGVFDLLEYWGFRKYTPSSTHIPEKTSITLPPDDSVFVPRINFREDYYTAAFKQGFFDWHKLDAHKRNWGMWVHTFSRLVPPGKYKETHPEYYALRNGKRRPTQLCLSNPEVPDIAVKNLGKMIEENPDKQYWSVSQNDNGEPCLCDSCKALNKRYGGDSLRHSGSIIYFANQVARKFPDKTISTLAYWYSRQAPDHIQPEPNLNIMLCNIESERHKPVPITDPAFTTDLQKWGNLTDNILIWDYAIQFRNLISPFPNLHTIKPNINFFVDNNVTKLFEQGNREVGGEMAYLRAYLIAKLMWNPSANDEAIVDDFVNGYYGDAGPHIGQYIDTMKHVLLESGQHLSIFGGPVLAKDTYLSDEMMREYKRLFDQAEAAVEDKPEMLRRVQIARLPIMFAQLEIARRAYPRRLYKRTATGEVAANREIQAMLSRFGKLSEKQGVTRVHEWHTTPGEYVESYGKILHKQEEDNLAYRKKITSATTPAKQYEPQGSKALTNGWTGSPYNHAVNWVGYEAEHMEFILDLGEVMSLDTLHINFYSSAEERILLPKHVSYSTSLDGEHYSDTIKVNNPNKPDKKGRFVQSFPMDMDRNVRYIKVHAESLLDCPSWHPKEGDPVWLFADEIVVR